MNRRSFFQLLGLAPAAAIAVKLAPIIPAGASVPKIVAPHITSAKLMAFRKEITRDYIRENLFKPSAPYNRAQLIAGAQRDLDRLMAKSFGASQEKAR